jgi:lysozyme
MRSIPPAAFDLVKEQEDSILWVYDDAKGARHKDGSPREVVDGDKILGVLTAGTGHTGADVVPGMTVTQEMNDAWLYDDLEEAAHKITAKIGAAIVDMLTENQWIALLDFVLNLGTGRPDRPEWTIWKRLRDKHFDQVPLEMAKFVNAEVGGVMRKIPDLVRRRNKEIEIWSTDEPGTRDVQMPSSVTRAAITPPTPSDPVPVSKSKALLLGAAGSIAGAPPMINQVSQSIQPYAHHSEYVQKVLAILATLAALCAAAGLAYMWLSKRQARN